MGDLCEMADGLGVAVHVAVMRQPFLDSVLEGHKTIESRMTMKRSAPFHHIEAGDVLLLKEASGPIRGAAVVDSVMCAGPLTRCELSKLLVQYEKELCLTDSWIALKSEAKFLTLIWMRETTRLDATSLEKRDPRAWVTVRSTSGCPSPPLFFEQQTCTA